MKLSLALVFAGLCAFAVSEHVTADKEFLRKQKDVLTILKHVNQPSYNQEYVQLAKTYVIEKQESSYTKPEVFQHFYEFYENGLLPRGAIFSAFYEEHLQQAIALFKLFYYAKDYETFYKTAVWARQNVNEGLFLYAYSVAVVHRPDTYGIILPPIYEIYPYYFYSTEAINKAQYYKQIHDGQYDGSTSGYTGYTIDANYSGYYLNLHHEQSLSYYLEDVGINAFYYYYNLYYPYWMSGEEFNIKNDNRGELYYYAYQQLVARYYLERLSNKWGEIPLFNWELPIETPYYPSLQYPNGLEFPVRPKFAKLYEYFYNYGQSGSMRSIYAYTYTFLRDYERRINDAIDAGVAFTRDGKKIDLYTKEGFNVLGNLIQSNPDSPNQRYYGPYPRFARHALGYSYIPLDKNKVIPSALEHFETSLRDPMFYQLYKKIILKFQRYKSNVPAYTRKELSFPGVKVQRVEFDRLITYFDYFYSDLSNAVYDTKQELEQDTFHVRARQYRLNHKPFTYKVYVTSDKDTKATVKIYLGPKYDEYGRYINISENRLNFYEFDHFVYDLKSGENTIKRNSYENYFFGPDRMSYKELYEKVINAYNGQGEFHVDGRQNFFYYPQRYMLPKGDFNGVPFQFYVIVYPYIPYKGQVKEGNTYHYPRPGSGGLYIDGYPLGYPFDRFIYQEQSFYNLPNSYFYETKIYHRNVEDINASYAE